MDRERKKGFWCEGGVRRRKRVFRKEVNLPLHGQSIMKVVSDEGEENGGLRFKGKGEEKYHPEAKKVNVVQVTRMKQT